MARQRRRTRRGKRKSRAPARRDMASIHDDVAIDRIAAAEGNAAIAAFVSIGARRSDPFTDVVFQERLRNAHRLEITALDLDGVRTQLIDFISGVTGTRNSLDIVADAPDGIQKIDNAVLMALVNDDGTERDEQLIAAIRSKFAQCRLVGCVTGVDEVRGKVRDLARRLQLPMIGTLRGIAYTDFDDDAFRDTQDDGQTKVATITMTSAVEGDDSARVEALQRSWLTSDVFRQVAFNGVAQPIGPPAALVWDLPHELVGTSLAASDVIRSAPLSAATLRTPSGKTYPGEVLARGTLLRVLSPDHGWLYLNVAPSNPDRRNFLDTLRQQGTMI